METTNTVPISYRTSVLCDVYVDVFEVYKCVICCPVYSNFSGTWWIQCLVSSI